MVVLDQHAVVEPHAVILGSSHSRRIFAEKAQPRHGLAGIEQDCTRPGNGIDVAARKGGDPRKMLQRVECRPFGGEHGAGIALEHHQGRARFDPVAVVDALVDTHFAVERPEKSDRDIEPGDDDRLARIKIGPKPRVGVDRRS